MYLCVSEERELFVGLDLFLPSCGSLRITLVSSEANVLPAEPYHQGPCVLLSNRLGSLHYNIAYIVTVWDNIYKPL